MELSLQEIQTKITLLQKKHDEDIDLVDHTIGQDNYCLYCEQYKQLLRKEQKLKKIKNTDVSSFKEITLAPTVSVQSNQKQLFEISLKNGDKYMVYALDIDQAASLLKVPTYSIVKHTELPKKYWNTLYIESENGTLLTAKQLIAGSRSKIISKYAPSNNIYVRHYCFNETPFEYIVYNKDHYDLLEKFVAPYPITKTKKFKSNGRVTITLPTGAIGVSNDEVLLKITKKLIVTIDKEDFEENFSEQENLVWSVV
uniref:hypothetical protein n=1 Tax=Enterococcus faecalis TaxID=1351 RepID=UPI00359C7C3F